MWSQLTVAFGALLWAFAAIVNVIDTGLAFIGGVIIGIALRQWIIPVIWDRAAAIEARAYWLRRPRPRER